MRVGVIRGGMEVEIWKRGGSGEEGAQIYKDSHGNRLVRAGAQVTKVIQPPASAGAA
jgi:stearoyl-CoA desaturase (delta-9 desaturase)